MDNKLHAEYRRLKALENTKFMELVTVRGELALVEGQIFGELASSPATSVDRPIKLAQIWAESLKSLAAGDTLSHDKAIDFLLVWAENERFSPTIDWRHTGQDEQLLAAALVRTNELLEAAGITWRMDGKGRSFLHNKSQMLNRTVRRITTHLGK